MKQTLKEFIAVMPLIETQFYTFADRVSSGNYQGGSWKDETPAEGVIYTKLHTTNETMKACNPAAYYENEVSIEAFSIVVNLYFWSDLSFKLTGELKDLAIQRFHSLRDWAMNHHPDAGAIYALTD